MRYGGSVASPVVGAILYFAVRAEVQPVDINLIDDATTRRGRRLFAADTVAVAV